MQTARVAAEIGLKYYVEPPDLQYGLTRLRRTGCRYLVPGTQYRVVQSRVQPASPAFQSSVPGYPGSTQRLEQIRIILTRVRVPVPYLYRTRVPGRA